MEGVSFKKQADIYRLIRHAVSLPKLTGSRRTPRTPCGFCTLPVSASPVFKKRPPKECAVMNA
ncbi:hypothetical protein DYQ05_04140 [Treponema pedis]|nr:hypothetical protein DYQ05_04140 [Treponema pedis]